MTISKRSIVSIILVFCLLFITACSSSDDGDKDGDTPNVIDVDVDEKGTEDLGEVNVEEQVLLDQDDIIITLKSLNHDSFFGPELKVLIENNSEESITVQIRDSSINGVMIDGMFSSDVASNKKANDGITFMQSKLDEAGITTIQEIDFKFHIFDSESWDGILDSGVVTIYTDADSGYVQAYDDTGEIVVDEYGIKIIMKRVDADDSFWGADIFVFIENNSERDVTIQARDVSINGFMIDPIFSCDVIADKKAYDSITFFESDLIENDIESIDEIELSFHVFDFDGWDTIFDSSMVTVIF